MSVKEAISSPPCLPALLENVEPVNIIQTRELEQPKRRLISRRGFGNEGRCIGLLSNHFHVQFRGYDAEFYHYNVSIYSEDRSSMQGKAMGRRVMDKLNQMYSSDLEGKLFAYDGEKSLFTVGPLPEKHLDFTVILEDTFAGSSGGIPSNGSPNEGERKRSKRSHFTKTFNVEIRFASKIPLNSIALALKGSESDRTDDALRVLDIVLRQHAAKSGCLLVKQSFFNGERTNFTDIGGGVSGCRGFHSSFHTTQGGLSLNMDVSTTMIITPGPVVDFLLANQNVKDLRYIDWTKAKRMLKGLRIKTKHKCSELKIIGLSELPCHQQLFQMKVREGDQESIVQVTVFDYFVKTRGIPLGWSANVPCVDVGKPKRPNYLPMELCELVSLQRYTKALSVQQRTSLIEKSRQKPQERIRVVQDAMRRSCYEQDPFLASCGISIDKNLIQLDGRILNAPKLKVGNADECIPRNGRWNFNNKRFFDPIAIERWAIVNFSARCDLSLLSRELISCGRNKGVRIECPYTLVEENRQWIRAGPVVRVEKMFEQIMEKLPSEPQFLLCVLPEKKNSDIYGPWKKKNLHELGIVTQCISPTKINDQYLTNVLLKINAKLGGMNSLLADEHIKNIPVIKDIPTLILGMDVSHGSPGRSDIPSVAAVVGSRHWPLISRYRASVRTQSPKIEMIQCLYKLLPNGNDDGVIRELLLDFYQTSGARKPSQIIIFRDGVSQSQFNQVLNVELDQVIKAYKHLGDGDLPKFSIIVAQKNHHTKLFQNGSPENVPPGTVVDTTIVHPKNYDFYMCAHAGIIGTSRPTHYHVLLDEIGFSVDNLQKLVHDLSYVYQRSTSAISIVAPIAYAHLAAQQMSKFIKFDDVSETSSGQGVAGDHAIPELPRLHDDVSSSMFFC